MAFRINQKVVCIKKDAWNVYPLPDGDHSGPAHGDVVIICATIEWLDIVWLELVDWPNDMFDAKWFRPLTDISIFTDLLRDVPLQAKPVDTVSEYAYACQYETDAANPAFSEPRTGRSA